MVLDLIIVKDSDGKMHIKLCKSNSQSLKVDFLSDISFETNVHEFRIISELMKSIEAMPETVK